MRHLSLADRATPSSLGLEGGKPPSSSSSTTSSSAVANGVYGSEVVPVSTGSADISSQVVE